MPWQPHQVGAKESGRKQKQKQKNRAVLLNFQGDRASSYHRSPYHHHISPIWHQVDAMLMLIMLLESERMHFRKQKQEQK